MQADKIGRQYPNALGMQRVCSGWERETVRQGGKFFWFSSGF